MNSDDVLKYVQERLEILLSKYKEKNICGLGCDRFCNNNDLNYRIGSGCCVDCSHHNINSGCSITNLCCMSFFCDSVKNQIDEQDWIRFKSTLIILQSLGLEPRDEWYIQLIALDIKIKQLRIKPEDLFNLFKDILE